MDANELIKKLCEALNIDQHKECWLDELFLAMEDFVIDQEENIATCPKCEVSFQWNNPNEKPPEAGMFCPNCSDLGYTLKGVLNFSSIERENKNG